MCHSKPIESLTPQSAFVSYVMDQVDEKVNRIVWKSLAFHVDEIDDGIGQRFIRIIPCEKCRHFKIVDDVYDPETFDEYPQYGCDRLTWRCDDGDEMPFCGEYCSWAVEKEDKVAENLKETVDLVDGAGNVVYSYERDVDEGFDPVSRPEHYCSGGLECIDWIRAMLTEEEFNGYLKGNALKYIWRYDQKDKENPKQDLRKAIWYLDKLCEVLVL